MAELKVSEQELRDAVRERYAAAASAMEQGCCGPGGCGAATSVFGESLYESEHDREVPEAALALSLGCGNPTAVAELREGETVLDLGSGAGADVLLSARRVGPSGKVYGVDMTEEMLAQARNNAKEAGVANVEWLEGYIEDVLLPDASVDVIISNCVINLSGDKPQVMRESFRVLRPGGRFAVTDVIADRDMDDDTRRDIAKWTGCIAGALTRDQFEDALGAAGFTDIEIRETHRVHEHAGSAIIRARKPSADD
jgi:ubiquinone/menaquinone biosynthesis C-methylase UbiE